MNHEKTYYRETIDTEEGPVIVEGPFLLWTCRPIPSTNS